MKTFLRVLIILAAVTVIGGLMYVGVNASGSSDVSSFDEGRPPQFDRDGDDDGDGFRPGDGEFRSEGEHEEHGERGRFGFPGGVIKALIHMTVAGLIYSAVVWIGKRIKKKPASS